MPTCVFCIPVRNNQQGLRPVLNNINAVIASGIFNNVKIAVFYDRSEDRSLEILHGYRDRFPEIITIVENNEPMLPTRVERIANARNRLLAVVRTQFADFEYFCMMDSNDYSCIGRIVPETIHKMLARADEWDAISFDRKDGYYDLWALSISPFVYSCFHFKRNVRAIQLVRDFIAPFLETRRRTDPNGLIPVLSAFNGCAFYKTAIFLDCRYATTIDHGLFPDGTIERHRQILGGDELLDQRELDCEHRHFHLEGIRRGARIRISLTHLFEGTKKMSNGIFDSTTENLAKPSFSKKKNLFTKMTL